MILDDIKKEIRNEAVEECAKVIRDYRRDHEKQLNEEGALSVTNTVIYHLQQRIESLYERD